MYEVNERFPSSHDLNALMKYSSSTHSFLLMPNSDHLDYHFLHIQCTRWSLTFLGGQELLPQHFCAMSQSSSSQHQSSATPGSHTTDYNSDSELSNAPINLTLMNRSFDAAILKSKSNPTSKAKKRKIIAASEDSDSNSGDEVLSDNWSRTITGRAEVPRQPSTFETLPNEVFKETVTRE
jgi:hypothetical protein